MELRTKLLGLVVLVNGLLLGFNLWRSAPQQVAPSVGLRAEWIEIEKPWLPAPKPASKINLQAGQAQLQKAMDEASNATQLAAIGPSVKPTPVPQTLCKLWGPFLVTEAERIAQALRAWPGAVQRQSKPIITGYVVYVPPAVVATGITLETLRAKGVREMLVISNPGSLQGSISLGLFRDQERAREHQEQMLALSVPGVAVRERFGPDRVFFELRGSATHMQVLNRIYEQSPRGQLQACETP